MMTETQLRRLREERDALREALAALLAALDDKDEIKPEILAAHLAEPPGAGDQAAKVPHTDRYLTMQARVREVYGRIQAAREAGREALGGGVS